MLTHLKIEPPELEPDHVLLAQLSQLSAASVRQRREGPTRALVAAVTVLVLACFSWLTGTLPGVASPFDSVRHTAPLRAPDSPPSHTSDDTSDLPSQAGAVPPGQVRTQHDNGNHTGLTKPNHHDQGNHTGLTGTQHDQGNHYGQTKPHSNNGHHTGQVKPHTNNGHHTGQVKPHASSGNHTGQTKPHTNSGHHTGQTKPHPDHSQQTIQGNGHGNSHRT